MPLPLRVALNSIASEAFRDQADRDYVLARAAWKLRLRDQFLWSAQQAIEKYLKGVLLFDGQSARYIPSSGKRRREYGHSLTALSAAVDALPGYQTTHPSSWQNFIDRLEHMGQNRYLTRNARTNYDSLDTLDEAVWSVRRYCQHMRFTMKRTNGGVMEMLPAYMQTVNHPSYQKHPHQFRLIGGQLEKWIAGPRDEPARSILIWNNRFFGSRARHNLRYGTWSSFVNSPVQRAWAQDPILRAELAEYFRFD